MAVAARPGPTDARVSCPLCGGSIHPVAGKCKHCKADLSAYHAARPAASAPLPALHRAAGNGHSGGQVHGTSGPTGGPDALAAHPAVVVAHEVQPALPILPVLPPRPSGRSPTVEPRASGWRSWPVLVIVLAMVAIVVAVVLMVWPESAGRGRDPGKRALQPPPAPERMPTAPDIGQPLPARPAPAQPHAAVPDPWNPPTSPAPQAPGIDPSAPSRPADSTDSADATDPDDDDAPGGLKDPFATPRGPAGGGRPALKLNSRGTMLFAMVAHVCRKMAQCGNDDATMSNLCDGISRGLANPPANCPAATRCLQHIDQMSCGSQLSDLSQVGVLVTQFRDCADAAGC